MKDSKSSEVTTILSARALKALVILSLRTGLNVQQIVEASIAKQARKTLVSN